MSQETRDLLFGGVVALLIVAAAIGLSWTSSACESGRLWRVNSDGTVEPYRCVE